MKYLIFAFIVFLVCNCKGENHQNDIIDLLSSPVSQINNLTEVALDISYIPLQTTDSSIISRISKFLVVNDFYYVVGDKTVMCFDKSGKLVSKLDKNGRGPEEYEYILDMDISPDNKFLAIKGAKSLVIYNIKQPGFSFMRRIRFSQPPFNISFTGSDNNLLLQYSNNEGNKPYSRILINLSGDTLKVRPNYLRFTLTDGWISTIFYENISYWYKNVLYLKELQNDTLFCFDSSRFLVPKHIFDSKGKGVTPEARSNGLYFSNHGSEYMVVNEVFESDRYIYYSSYYSDIGSSNIVEKSTGKKFSVDSKKGLKDDLAGGVSFRPKYCKNGIFYSWIDAFKLKEYLSTTGTEKKNVKYPEKNKSLIELAGTIDENDNPVLIIVTMK